MVLPCSSNRPTPIHEAKATSASATQRFKKYPGLWWRIWLTLIASIAIYALCTSIYFRYWIWPRVETVREEERQEFRAFLEQQKSAYAQQIEHWRYESAPGTPAPIFEPPPPPKHSHHRHAANAWFFTIFTWLSLMALVLGVATFPIARRLTRRLRQLQKGVEAFGSGNLKARVDIAGHDEVALLAQSFNTSAQHIEILVHQHKQLLAQVSHELRTPLARLRMGAELACTKVPEIADDLRTDIRELDELVEEILLASRLDAAPNLLQISSFDALALAAEETARTRAELHGQSVEIEADESLIRRALRNLLTNAERYAPGTSVIVTVGLEAQTATVTPQVCFTVTDQGPGIPETERARVFEPFYRARGAAPGGTGLGLSLVQQIAQRHGGSVVCFSGAKRGCRFELRIPVRSSPAHH